MALPEQERARYRAATGQQRGRVPNAVVGALAAVLALFGLYLAYTKHLPFTDHGYELEATFSNAVDIPAGSPVRIAGVNVGEVLEVIPDGENSKVRFTVSDDGRPVAADAMVKIRPRIFFEGSYFLDLDPGSPTAPELAAGGAIPLSHTATAVQFDEILSALREPTRRDLGRLLSGYGTALTHEPTAAEDVGFEDEVKGLSAAGALNRAFDYGPRAGRASAQVAEALLGTEPGDLAGLIASSARTFEAVAADERALGELITNWNTFTGALADESANLSGTFAELAPTLETTERSLAELNRALPVVRTWARVFEPAVAELPAVIAAGNPWLDQARPLLSRAEAGGLVKLVRRATPDLAAGAAAGIETSGQLSQLSRCTSKVLVPTGDQVIDDRFSSGAPNYREFFYATVNLAGESANFDGNGDFLRLMPSVGDLTASTPNPAPVPGLMPDDVLWANLTSDPLGTQPQLGKKPPYRPEVKCFKNDVPALNSGPAAVGAPSPAPSTPPGP